MVHLITGHAGKAHVKASDEAKINKALYGDVEAAVDYGNNFAITLPSNNAVQIDTGLFYMQGRWIDIPSPESVPFDNGVAGMNRNDLVVFRYSMDPDTSVETVELVIKKGASTSGTAEDPALESGLIDSGALVNEVPLYRIPISGINIGEPVKLFNMIQINIMEMRQGILDTMEEVEANEEEGKIAGALALKELVPYECTIPSGTDLNTITTSGFYRLQDNHLNTPSNLGYPSDWSQMLVIKGGGDTIAQIIVDYSTTVMLVRSGCSIVSGGENTWTSWTRMLNTSNFTDNGDTLVLNWL